MSLLNELENYEPINEQEERDKLVMMKFIQDNPDYLERTNLIAHFTTSIWTVNKERTKTVMIYHNIYNSWSWIGGHADGVEDLKQVALRELQEETGIANARLISDKIFSVEVLTVDGHIKKGQYVPSHLHLNVTYLAEADDSESFVLNEEETSGVRWCTLDEALTLSTEPWFVENIYKKLIDKMKNM